MLDDIVVLAAVLSSPAGYLVVRWDRPLGDQNQYRRAKANHGASKYSRSCRCYRGLAHCVSGNGIIAQWIANADVRVREVCKIAGDSLVSVLQIHSSQDEIISSLTSTARRLHNSTIRSERRSNWSLWRCSCMCRQLAPRRSRNRPWSRFGVERLRAQESRLEPR